MTKINLIRDALASGPSSNEIVERALHMLRVHLGMDIAFVSEFAGEEIIFHAVDAPGADAFAQKGTRWPVADTYCAHIAAGLLPAMAADTEQDARAQDHPATASLAIRSYVAAPIKHANGSLFGMLCCLSRAPELTLTERDHNTAEMFAVLVQREVRRNQFFAIAGKTDPLHVGDLIDRQGFALYAQPIVDLDSKAVAGYEVLSRFQSDVYAGAEAVFAAAAELGRLAQLEMDIIAAALRTVQDLPEPFYLAVNASPSTVLSSDFNSLFDDIKVSRCVLEITEHHKIDDYASLLEILAPLRAKGLRLAVDDAGIGHSGLHQILRLQPDLIKLDRMMVQGIDADRAKRSMCAAMVHYASETGAILIAEGVETEAERATLLGLGVYHGQGFAFARPGPLGKFITGSAA